jgi:hypothetical protein
MVFHQRPIRVPQKFSHIGPHGNRRGNFLGRLVANRNTMGERAEGVVQIGNRPKGNRREGNEKEEDQQNGCANLFG